MADAGDAERKREQELRKIVLQWMNRKGYKAAAEAFEKEIELGGTETIEEMVYRKGMEPDFCIKNYILQWGMEDTKPARYEESYCDLRDWLMKLIDDYRDELAELMYPVFVHLFLDLVQKQYAVEAKEFLANFRHEHEPEHTEELSVLSGVLDAQQLEKNPVSHRFLCCAKYRVYLCHDTDKMLTEFLHNKRLHIIVRLINVYIDIHIYGQTLRDSVRTMPLSSADPDAKNQPKRPRLRFAETTEEALRARHEPAATGGGDAMEVEAGEGESVQLPPLSAEAEKKILSDLSRRVPVGKGALPSVCCYTLFNARTSLNCLDVSADARTVAAGLADSGVQIWDASRGDGAGGAKGAAATGCGHSGPVYGTAVSPDGRFVLSASRDTTVRLWDSGGASNLVTYRGHNYPVWDVAFSAVSHYFVSGSHDRTARLWSTDHVYPLRLLAGHLSSVDCVTFHPNCNYIASGSSDKTCRMWDICSGNCVRLFKGLRAPVTALSMSSCGKLLAAGADDGQIMVWDLATSNMLHSFRGHTGSVHSVDFALGETTLLASGGQDGTVRLWDASSGAGGGDAGASASSAAAVGDGARHPGELTCLKTKQTRVLKVRFSRTNLLLAAGAFAPDK